MQGLLEFVKTLGAPRIAAMVAVTLALVGFFAFLILRVSSPQMTPLFTDLSYEDSSAIVKELERQSVSYELRNDGAIVMVPKDRVARLRMSLAGEGLPKGGGVGYEIFDKSDALGTTSFIQNINNLRALEGELARTIRAIDRVVAARVHLVLPERPLFSRDKVEPSASIVLKVRGTLEQQQVRAIRHLVASAVNGLKPQRVSIVDESGRLLADGSGSDDLGEISADERRVSFEKRLREQVEAHRLIGRRPGSGPHPGQRRFRLQPHHRDLGQVRSRRARGAIEPDPRGSRPDNETRDNQVTVGNEIPGANQQRGGGAPADANAAPRDQSRKSEEIVNYEISKTTKTEVIEGGRINRISVAVLVDGAYGKNDRGDVVYEPRSKEEIEQIAALVRTAIGFDQKRGDQVEVVNLRFAETRRRRSPSPPAGSPACNSPRTTSCAPSSWA